MIVLARLAVDKAAQGQGVGRDLMLAALSRAIDAQEHSGGAFVIVDAVGEKAQRLYAHQGFSALPVSSPRATRMVVRMAEAAALLGSS